MDNSKLPNGWISTKLSEVLDAVNGKAFKSRDWRTSGTPIIRIQNLKIKDAPFNYYTGDIEDKYRVNKGDLLFAWSGTPGTSFGAHIWYGPDALLNQHIFRIDFPKQLMNLKYLHLALNKNVESYIEQAQGGVGLAHITKTKFMNSTLLLPPLNEQNRIVAKIEELFSELDEGVENLQKAKEQLGVYRQSLLKHAFEGKLTEEWRKNNADKLESGEALLKRIKKEREEYFKQELEQWGKDVAQWEADGKPGKKPTKPRKLKKLDPIKEEELKDLPQLPEGWVWGRLGYMTCGVEYGTSAKSKRQGKYPVLRMGNIQECRFIYDDLVFTDDEEEYSKYKLKPGDVLFNRTNSPELVGKTAVFKADFPALFAGYLIRVNQIDSMVNSDYLNYFLNSHIAKIHGDRVKSDGVNQSNINGAKLADYPFPYCSLEEQILISSIIIDRLSASIELEQDIESRLQQSDSLRNAILAKAFSGQLVPQDPADEPASELLEKIKQERENAPKPKRSRKPNVAKKRITMADLKKVLTAAKDWVSAQDAFRQCDIADGAQTDEIEKLYEELKQYVDQHVIEVERRRDQDWLRLVSEG